MTELIIPLLLILVVAALMIEKEVNEAARRSFIWVIHVNGIRGKTTVSRMLDAVLKSRYRVLTKTTGSDARVIHVNGRDECLRRLGPAAINEQLRIIRLAKKEGAEVLVLECMAVKPEYQQVCEESIIGSNIGIITNVRYDHMLEMGESLPEIARSLCMTIPRGGSLYTAEAGQFDLLRRVCEERGSEAFLCCPEGGDGENESIVRAVAMRLGCTDKEINAGLSHVQEDRGMHEFYCLENTEGKRVDFLNLFAANDPQSALMRLNKCRQAYTEIIFLFNCRSDRPDRSVLFARHFFPCFPHARLILIGPGRSLAQRLFLKQAPGLNIVKLSNWQKAMGLVPSGVLLVGLGNIKGEGIRLLETARQVGDML